MGIDNFKSQHIICWKLDRLHLFKNHFVLFGKPRRFESGLGLMRGKMPLKFRPFRRTTKAFAPWMSDRGQAAFLFKRLNEPF